MDGTTNNHKGKAMDILCGRSPSSFSEKDLNHIKVWVNDPDLIAQACQEVSKLVTEGLDPKDYYWVWAITIKPRRWAKSDGLPTSHVTTTETVPLVVFDLGKLPQSAPAVTV
jgi:hypothetical protein